MFGARPIWHLARNGIAGFAVDTFSARNPRSSDNHLERLKKAPIHTQMADAMSALLALQDHPHSDGYTMGFNREAFDQSREDVLQFLTTNWVL